MGGRPRRTLKDGADRWENLKQGEAYLERSQGAVIGWSLADYLAKGLET
jgi:hypothetical protein